MFEDNIQISLGTSMKSLTDKFSIYFKIHIERTLTFFLPSKTKALLNETIREYFFFFSSLT